MHPLFGQIFIEVKAWLKANNLNKKIFISCVVIQDINHREKMRVAGKEPAQSFSVKVGDNILGYPSIVIEVGNMESEKELQQGASD